MVATLKQKAVDVLQKSGYYIPDTAVGEGVLVDVALNLQNKALYGTDATYRGDLTISKSDCDWIDTVKGNIDYHALSSRWDSNFKAGQRGVMTFKVKRTPTQKVLAHIPLHSWASDYTGPLTTQECADEVIARMRSQGVEFWREPTRNENEFTVYFVAGWIPAAIAFMAIGMIGIGLLVNWTLDTMTCMRIKQDYAKASIEAAEEIQDPAERAKFLANEAEKTKSKSLLDFGLGDTLSGGLKTAVILVGIAAAAVVLIWGVSRS